jgi:hypothetical protein
MLDLAFQHIHFAGTAQPMIAGIRQPDAGAQSRIQQLLAFLDLYRLPQRFNGSLERHLRILTEARG